MLLCDVMPNFMPLCAILQIVIMLNGNMLSVVFLNVVILSVVMLSVMAPFQLLITYPKTGAVKFNLIIY